MNSEPALLYDQPADFKGGRTALLICVFFVSITACTQSTQQVVRYPRQVGNSVADATIDGTDFKPCDTTKVYQYYNLGKGLQYTGEKAKIIEHFKLYRGKTISNESGFITIRFIVNCQGKTGRFRVQGMDTQYQEKKFNKELLSGLLALTKQLDGWIPGYDGVSKVDYYQYLTFKIENGKLIEIAP